ncbi:ADYC domain-containing protein [Hyalangium minutum]|uniref:ADYC domain-containing protein n=1 Tax=Hyalangium minutum TaxID=394096 RepID=A0A085W712_9BACT|nr:ADYC domain-containing protein [Hyalangium minutum]KFE63475.1 hypothetical protein DB31_2593 [Hyalangium minutum]
MKSSLILLLCLLASTSTRAAVPERPKPARPAPCQGQTHPRTSWPQGTMLWGTARQTSEDAMSSVLTSVYLDGLLLKGAPRQSASWEKGQLTVPGLEPAQLAGALLRGTASDGASVEVALCGAERSAENPALLWYQIELWNPRTSSWENPCIATARVPSPRVLAVNDLWDATGASKHVEGQFTFACENGAIAKCVRWGYTPWESKDGRSMRELHQACTRMARADYCGNGRSHTREDTPLDIYDSLSVLARTRELSSAWDPARASFEAAWTPDGAACLSRTRDGRALETLRQECPELFEEKPRDLGEGDQCTWVRKGSHEEEALLRNRSYAPASLAGDHEGHDERHDRGHQ